MLAASTAWAANRQARWLAAQHPFSATAAATACPCTRALRHAPTSDTASGGTACAVSSTTAVSVVKSLASWWRLASSRPLRGHAKWAKGQWGGVTKAGVQGGGANVVMGGPWCRTVAGRGGTVGVQGERRCATCTTQGGWGKAPASALLRPQFVNPFDINAPHNLASLPWPAHPEAPHLHTHMTTVPIRTDTCTVTHAIRERPAPAGRGGDVGAPAGKGL